jgi:uncharacterized protein (DUF2141 family)
MKKIYLALVLSAASIVSNSQNCPVQVIVTPPLCFGQCNGSAIAYGTGNGPFTYQWTTNPMQTTQTATGLCAGTYSVIVVNGSNCTGVATVNVSQPTQLQALTTSQASSSCINCNGSIVSTVFGGTTPYTYIWMPGNYTTATVTGVCPGTYSLVVSDANGCSTLSTATITGPQGPSFGVSATPANNQNCNNGTATATPTNMGNYTYSWSTNPTQTTQTATGLTQGIYTVCVTDVNGCSSCQVVTVTCLQTGISNYDLENTISVFPNPTAGNITVQTSAKIISYEITGALGNTVLNPIYALNQSTINIDLTTMPQGIYFIKLNTPDGQLVKRIVKE